MLDSIKDILKQIKYNTASIIEGGYFYSFTYRFDKNPNNSSKNTNGWDKEPIIISMGALRTNPNYIVGLNIHFIDKPYLFLDILNSFSAGCMSRDGYNKIILNNNILERIYNPSTKAIRLYNKKLISSCYRIENKYVKQVLDYQTGNYYMSSPRHNELQNDLKRHT